MPSSYPTGLDTFTTGTLTGVVSGSDHGNKGDAINKIEAELGLSPSGGFATVKAKLDALPFVLAAEYGFDTAATGAANATALNAALATGQSVQIGDGAFDVSSAVTFPYGNNGQVIRGTGAGLTGASGTTITWTGGAAYVFTLGGNTSGNFARWQFIEDLELVGNASAFGGVLFQGTRWCGMRRVYVRNFTGAGNVGVIMEASSGTSIANYFNRIEHCFFDNCPYGIYLRGETGGTGANSNVITDCTFGACGTFGICIDGGDTNRVMFCEFDNAGAATGLQVTGTNSSALYNTVMGCMFDGVSAGVLITHANAQYTRLLQNAGPNYTITDGGTHTYRSDVVATSVPAVASAATVTLTGVSNFFSVSGTTTITSLTASWAGRIVTLTFQGALTFTDGSNLKLAGNFVTTADDTITLVSDGTNWVEIARSVN